MCGIAGFTRFSNQWGEIDQLQEMGRRIEHRGPDAKGELLEESVGLCHRRLSIVDLSDAGKQPMTTADGEVTIVFNGEIYNFLELRETLSNQGYQFVSHTDTEVLLALYQLDGLELLEKINGMFAFAIWDRKLDRLFLARDRIGKKPLYYYVKDNDIVFASELKSILSLPQIPRVIRPDAVYDFFSYQYIPDPKSIFENIFKLDPGHYLVVSSSGITKKQYWDVPFGKALEQDESVIQKKLLGIVKRSTRQRMISDVPLGAFLSGGVDSSGIVALMANSSDKPVTTCSIAFDDNRYNETEFAQLVADQYATDHHKLTVNQELTGNIEKIATYFDEPFADPSLVPTYYVSLLARSMVTVALSGDGGDEVFAGYQKYSIDHIESRLRNLAPEWMRKNILPFASRCAARINNKTFRKASSLLHSLSLDPAMGFFVSNSQVSDSQWIELIKPDFKASLKDYHPSQITVDYYNAAKGPDHVSRILYTDMKTTLCGGILVKVDRMSMANSLEVRAPLLDKEVLEYAAQIPSRLKFRNGKKKLILKQIFSNLLPESILSRKKMGFSVPLANWLRSELKEFTEIRLLQRGNGLNDIFEAAVIKKLWAEHQARIKDHSTLIWSMLMYQVWWDNYMSPHDND